MFCLGGFYPSCLNEALEGLCARTDKRNRRLFKKLCRHNESFIKGLLFIIYSFYLFLFMYSLCIGRLLTCNKKKRITSINFSRWKESSHLGQSHKALTCEPNTLLILESNIKAHFSFQRYQSTTNHLQIASQFVMGNFHDSDFFCVTLISLWWFIVIWKWIEVPLENIIITDEDTLGELDILLSRNLAELERRHWPYAKGCRKKRNRIFTAKHLGPY